MGSGETQHVAFKNKGMIFIACALQDFEQNDVSDQDLVFIFNGSELLNGRALLISQVLYPNRAINDDHR